MLSQGDLLHGVVECERVNDRGVAEFTWTRKVRLCGAILSFARPLPGRRYSEQGGAGRPELGTLKTDHSADPAIESSAQFRARGKPRQFPSRMIHFDCGHNHTVFSWCSLSDSRKSITIRFAPYNPFPKGSRHLQRISRSPIRASQRFLSARCFAHSNLDGHTQPRPLR